MNTDVSQMRTISPLLNTPDFSTSMYCYFSIRSTTPYEMTKCVLSRAILGIYLEKRRKSWLLSTDDPHFNGVQKVDLKTHKEIRFK